MSESWDPSADEAVREEVEASYPPRSRKFTRSKLVSEAHRWIEVRYRDCHPDLRMARLGLLMDFVIHLVPDENGDTDFASTQEPPVCGNRDTTARNEDAQTRCAGINLPNTQGHL